MPRKVRGTSTLSILNTIYISLFPIFLYNLYSVALSEYSKSFLLENYIYVIILAPNLRTVPLDTRIELLYYSSTIELL